MRSGKVVPMVVVCMGVVMCFTAAFRIRSNTEREVASDKDVRLTSLLLASLPAGEVMTPTQVKELEGESIQALIAGRIDAGDVDPFQSGRVAFLISQLPDKGHDTDDPDHVDNCPFCKRKLANAPKALVEFRDENGDVLQGDAQQLLGLAADDVVFVSGTVRYEESLNTVMVDATGLYQEPND